MTTLIHLPLHVVGRSNVLVTYRDGHEVFEKAAAKIKGYELQEQGLFTEGLFGPILSTVVGDALKGKITWGRWEEGANGTEAVFHYAVPREQSHYSVCFSCLPNGIRSDADKSGDCTRSPKWPLIMVKLHSTLRTAQFFASHLKRRCRRMKLSPRAA